MPTSSNPQGGKQALEEISRVLDCADRLDAKPRLSIGLTQSMINEARKTARGSAERLQ